MISILLMIIALLLFFFCLFLLNTNKELKKRVIDLEVENRKILDKKIVNQVKVEAVPIENISVSELGNIEDKKNISDEIEKDRLLDNRDSARRYQREDLHRWNQVTSPVSIPNMDKISLDPLEYISTNKGGVSAKNNREVPDYLKELSKTLSDGQVSQAIELTDYEKKQEDQAIISYQELLQKKDELINLVDDDEGDFIEDLKMFRSNLD